MTRKHRLTRTALALATAVAATPALADTVTTSGWYFGGGKSVNTKTTATVIYGGSSHSPIDKSVSAGAFRATWNGRTFETYCTDIFQTIGLTATYSGFSLHDGDAWFSPAKARDLGRLWTVAHDGAGADAVDAKSSAAFQIAAWEILYESSGSYNLASGVFRASGGSAATGSPSALQHLARFASLDQPLLGGRAGQRDPPGPARGDTRAGAGVLCYVHSRPGLDGCSRPAPLHVFGMISSGPRDGSGGLRRGARVARRPLPRLTGAGCEFSHAKPSPLVRTDHCPPDAPVAIVQPWNE